MQSLQKYQHALGLYVFVSYPQLYGTVRIVSSVVKSDYKTIVALPSESVATVAMACHQRQCRPRTPSQNASLLQHLAATDMGRLSDVDELARTTE